MFNHSRGIGQAELRNAPRKHFLDNLLRIGGAGTGLQRKQCLEDCKLLDHVVTDFPLFKYDAFSFVEILECLRKFLKLITLNNGTYEIGIKDLATRSKVKGFDIRQGP